MKKEEKTIRKRRCRKSVEVCLIVSILLPYISGAEVNISNNNLNIYIEFQQEPAFDAGFFVNYRKSACLYFFIKLNINEKLYVSRN